MRLVTESCFAFLCDSVPVHVTFYSVFAIMPSSGRFVSNRYQKLLHFPINIAEEAWPICSEWNEKKRTDKYILYLEEHHIIFVVCTLLSCAILSSTSISSIHTHPSSMFLLSLVTNCLVFRSVKPSSIFPHISPVSNTFNIPSCDNLLS